LGSAQLMVQFCLVIEVDMQLFEGSEQAGQKEIQEHGNYWHN
jgi:hypothetical protein